MKDAFIGTHHNTSLCVTAEGKLVHKACKDILADRSIEVFFCDDGEHALLLGPIDTTFSITISGPKSHSHLVKVSPEGSERFSILDMWSRRYLSARSVTGDHGTVECRNKVSDWEIFRISERRSLPISLEKLSRHLESPLSADQMLELLLTCEGDSANRIISALLPTMSVLEADILGRKILDSDSVCGKLQNSFSGDLWITNALPQLYTLDQTENTHACMPRKRLVDTRFDTLSTAGKFGVSESAGYVLNSLARRAVKPNRKACVVATARNEGVYLLEWVAYHRALGFDEIIIYSNNNTDGSDVILSALAEAGKIIWCDNQVDADCDAQSKSYAHALTVLPDTLAFEWCVFIDIDEFVVIDGARFTSLENFLDWHGQRQTDVIALSWVYFGSSAQAHWKNLPITQRLTSRKKAPNQHVKSIFRPRVAISAQPHFPRESERYSLIFRSGDSALYTSQNSPRKGSISKAFSDRPQTSHAFVAHFFFKTCEEFLWKFSRNRGDKKMHEEDITLTLEKRFLRSFLSQYRENQQEEVITKSNSGFESEYQELLNTPAIAKAFTEVTDIFQERLTRVIKLYRPFLESEMGIEGLNFLALMDEK